MQRLPHSFDLEAAARRAVAEAGFEPDFPAAARAEADRYATTPPELPTTIVDLRHLLWSSVDNAESRDLDQIEVAERLPDGDILLRVGIAEVDWLAPIQSGMDAHAAYNTSTIYTGIRNFSMLPEVLSTDLTSLLEGEDRVALVVELRVNPDGTLESKNLVRALVCNRARLSYESVGPWLEGAAPLPPEVAAVAGLEEQLRLQDETMARFLALRQQQGALSFETVEATPITENGRVVGMKVFQKNRARLLIENFMIATNTAVAEFLQERGVAAIQRVVHAPKRWPRIVEIARSVGDDLPEAPDPRALSAFLERRRAADPHGFPQLSLSVVKLLGPGQYAVVRAGVQSEGHFGLAVQGYTHSTAPNRRYCDVVTQRLIKATLLGATAPYDADALAEIAARCTERASAADKVERRLRKTAAAVFIRPQIGKVFDAVVTGVKRDAVYARLIDPAIEGRIVQNERGLDVGDRVRVKLFDANPDTGYIDFGRVTAA